MQINTDSLPAIDFSRIGVEDVSSWSLEEVVEKIDSLKKKLKELQKKEEEYNRNAAMVPESDPNLAAISDKIQAVKEEVERLSKERNSNNEQLREVGNKRAQLFVAFFDEVARILQTTYTDMTRSFNDPS